MPEKYKVVFGEEIIQSHERDMERLASLTAVMEVLEDSLDLFVENEPELEDRKNPYSDLIVSLTFKNLPSKGYMRICYNGDVYFADNNEVALFFMKYCLSEYRERLNELI